MNKNISVLVISTLLALSAATPVMITITPAHLVQSTQSHIVRVADNQPTPTPTFSSPQGGGGCGSQGCGT